MDNASIRTLILNTPLAEEEVSIPGWTANLKIRELDARTGSKLVEACTRADGTMDQDGFIAGVILATLRNADDPQDALVFSDEGTPDTYNAAYRDQLMTQTGLGKIMAVANQSIKLSGLDTAAAKSDAKNVLSGTVVEGSLSTSQPA